jgi:hypothetical protein
MANLRFTAVINSDEFEQRLKGVPLLPGVYIWKDLQGGVLYVGKSKTLRDRMRSYFNIANYRAKTAVWWPKLPILTSSSPIASSKRCCSK